MLFPTLRIAEFCRSFIQERSLAEGSQFRARLVNFLICPEDRPTDVKDEHSAQASSVELHIVLYPQEAGGYAKQFWQHTGMGLSSRLAEHCISLLPAVESAEPVPPRVFGKVLNRHYSANTPTKSEKPITSPLSSPVIEQLNQDHSAYLEERYGRNLPISAAAFAKRALCRRISGVLVDDDLTQAGKENLTLGPSKRDISELSEQDVYLYPTGMTAIWNAHYMARSIRPSAKSVCFG
jgi:cystathionine gamma-synthase